MLDVIHTIADEGYFLEVHQHYAKNIIVGFARLGGTAGRRCRQPACVPGGHAGHQRLGERRALRSLL
jgi:propionyl-CoA carboxylase beta chain